MNPADFVSSEPFRSTADAGADDDDAPDSSSDGATNHADAEGADPGGAGLGRPSPSTPSSTADVLRDALMSTDPDLPLESVESPFDPEHGGIRRIYRGFLKMTGASGVPAVVDVVLGLIEVSVQPPTAATRSATDAGAEHQGDGADELAGAIQQVEAMEETR